MLFKEGNIKSKVLPAVMMVGVVIVSFLAYVDKPEVAEAEWYSTGGTWTYRKTITIQHGQVSGTADHTSFPVLVDLTDADLAAEAQADGDDILFTSSDGSTKLDHEIELYTTATGRLTAWVRIPTLDYDNDTVIYMYYGNSGATNQQNPTGVWDSNYKGVWHMDEATGANRVDEISSFAMVEETGIDIDRISGKIGYAASAGTTNTNKRMEYLSSNLGINTNYTDSWWMKVNTEIGTGVYRTVDRRDITTLIGSITRYEYNSGTRRLVFWRAKLGGTIDEIAYNITLGTTDWYHLAVTYDGTTLRGYVNGVEVGNTTASGGGVTSAVEGMTAFARMGPTPIDYAPIAIDQIESSNTYRSPDWIATQYNNQSATSTFYTIGSEETDTTGGGSGATPTVKVTGGFKIKGGSSGGGSGSVTQTGSNTEFIATVDNTGTVSTTITVPSDAEMIVVGISGFLSTTPNLFSGGSMTFTKGGVDTAMTAVSGGDASSASWQAGMFYMVLPDTGSNKTLKWDWAGTGTLNNGPIVSITFWKGINTSGAVRGSGGGQNDSNTPYTSSSVTAQSGDLIVAWVAGFAGSEATINSWSNLSLLTQVARTAGNADGAWATGSPSGNIVVEASTDTNFEDGGIVAISLIPGVSSALTSPSISSFIASPASISQGNSSTLSWLVSGNPTPTLSISSIGSVSGSSISVSPTVTTTYTITATNSQGSTNSNITVTVTSLPPPDTTPPSVPTNLSASSISSSQINLSWTVSTDIVGVIGYKIYRGGVQIGTSISNSYSDIGLSASTLYSYTVSAYDAAGNNSTQSTSATATTQVVGGVSCGATNIRCVGSGQEYATIQVATNATVAGDTVIVYPGTYNETVTISRSGSVGNKIVYQGYSGSSCPTTSINDPLSRGVRPNSAATTQGFIVVADYVTVQCFKVVGGSSGLKTSGNARHDIDFLDNVVDGSITPGSPSIGIDIEPSNPVSASDLPHHIIISRNYITGTGDGVLIYANNVTLTDNESERMRGQGDGDHNVFWGDTILWEGNYYHGNRLADASGAHSDCWQTFNLGSSWVGDWQLRVAKNLIFTRNTCLEVDETFMVESTTDNLFNNWTITNNLLALPRIGGSVGGGGFGSTRNIFFYHNTIYNAVLGFGKSGANSITTATVRNNIFCLGCYIVHAGTGVVTASNNLETNTPGYVNTVNKDFHLQTGSMAINAGATGLGIAVDLDNRLRDSQPDIGAYEYTGSVTPPTSTKFKAGDRVQTTSNLNVRSTPSASGTLLGTQSLATLGTIISGGQSADGYYWWNINYDSGADGWSVEDYLQSYSAPIVGDFNQDGLVNSIDLSLMTSAWNTSNATYDLNRDGLVNSLDYVIMVQNWSV